MQLAPNVWRHPILIDAANQGAHARFTSRKTCDALHPIVGVASEQPRQRTPAYVLEVRHWDIRSNRQLSETPTLVRLMECGVLYLLGRVEVRRVFRVCVRAQKIRKRTVSLPSALSGMFGEP